jgi:acetyl-CoA carboxylase biotin carboxyl carrier protein
MAKKPSKTPKASPAKGKSEDALEEMKRLYRFMTEQGLERLEFGRDDYQVRLVRRRTAPAFPAGAVVAAAAASAAAGPLGGPAAPTHKAAAAKPEIPPGAWTVKSPMMGIFYRATSPSSPPFVKEGDTIKAGQVICLVEAMKVFNEVKAETDGRVLQVLLENGKPVQSGQDVFILTKK